MGVTNRRNAFLGWVIWAVFKGYLRQRARAAAPSVDLAARRPNRPAVALGFALAAGLAAFVALRMRGGADVVQ